MTWHQPKDKSLLELIITKHPEVDTNILFKIFEDTIC